MLLSPSYLNQIKQCIILPKVSAPTFNQTKAAVFIHICCCHLCRHWSGILLIKSYMFSIDLLFLPFVKEWWNGNGKTVADNSLFFPGQIVPKWLPLKKEVAPLMTANSKALADLNHLHFHCICPERTEKKISGLGLWRVWIYMSNMWDFPVDEDCLTKGKYLFTSNWERNNTAAKTSALSGWARRGCGWLKHGCNLF